DATEESIATGTANGFSFREYSPLAVSETLTRACNAYARPETWRKIVTVGMGQDWSWQRSAAGMPAFTRRVKPSAGHPASLQRGMREGNRRGASPQQARTPSH